LAADPKSSGPDDPSLAAAADLGPNVANDNTGADNSTLAAVKPKGSGSAPANLESNSPAAKVPEAPKTPKPTQALTAALHLARAGIKVVPARDDKRPIGFKWEEEATADENRLRSLFSHREAVTVSMPCGPNNLVVIDCDVKSEVNGIVAFESLCREHNIDLTTVPQVRTPSGGRHYVFSQPEGIALANSTGSLPKGIDVRGHGGQVIAAGSRIPTRGSYMRVEGTPDLADAFRASTIPVLPQALLEIIGKRRRRKRKPGEKQDWVGKAFVENPVLKQALALIDNVFPSRNELLPLVFAFAILSGGNAEIEAEVAGWAHDGERKTAVDGVRHIFDDYRAGGVHTRPGEACGNVCRWLREIPVAGGEEEAKQMADFFQSVIKRIELLTEFTDGAPADYSQFEMQSFADFIAPPAKEPDAAGRPTPETRVLEMNKEFAVFDGLGIARINPPATSSIGKRLSWYRSTEAFTLPRKNQKVTVGKVVKDIGTVWIEHPERRTYAGLGLWLVGAEPEGFFNLWTGLGVPPVAGNWDMMEAFLTEVICAQDAAKRDWLLNWIACGLQRPLEKGYVNPVLIGEQGTGKTFFGKLLLRIFGMHSVHLSKRSDLTGEFNSVLEDKVFAFADEAFFALDPSTTGTYKTLTTEETLSINEKFEPKRFVRNRLKLVFASNNAAAVPVEIGDRRSVWFEVSNCRRLDNGYFGNLQQALDAGELAAFTHAMLERDISTFDPRLPLRTEEKLKATKDQMTAVEKVIAGWIESGDLPGIEETLRRMGKEDEDPKTRRSDDWEDKSVCVLVDELFRAALREWRDLGERFRLTEEQFGRALNRLVPQAVIARPRVYRRGLGAGAKSQQRAYLIPSRPICERDLKHVLSG
jgi:hypothetical protein